MNEGEIGVAARVDLVKGNRSVLPTLLRFSYMENAGSATSMAYCLVATNSVLTIHTQSMYSIFTSTYIILLACKINVVRW